MGWVRLEDDFYDNPKIASVGPLGVALWIAGLAYCNRNLTDGLIPRSRARSLLDWDGIGILRGMGGDDATADHVIPWLVEAGLWHEVPGGYEIHDYLDYQESAETITARRLETSEKRREAGRRGGLVTQSRRSGEANKQTAKQISSNGSSKPEAKVKPQPQPPLLLTRAAVLKVGSDLSDAAAADLSFEEVAEIAFGRIADRRVAAKQASGGCSNPGGYRAAALAGIRKEYAAAIVSLDPTQPWTPETLVDYLEPPPPPPKPDPLELTGRAAAQNYRRHDEGHADRIAALKAAQPTDTGREALKLLRGGQ